MSEKKSILFLSTYDKDGGAASWFLNHAEVLYHNGYNVEMVVKYKRTNKPFVHCVSTAKDKNFLRTFLTKIYSKKNQRDIFFDADPEYAFFPKEQETDSVIPTEDIIKSCSFIPDFIISGLTYELANTNTLRQLHELWNVPVYMTAFDANVYTGGCHVIWDCNKYKLDCSSCPGLMNKERQAEIEESFAIKVKNIKEADIGIMYASPWSLHNALQSACFKDAPKFDIGMCIDTELYTDVNRDIAKQVFGLPENAKVIFAGSANVNDRRKGVKYLFDALSYLWLDLDSAIKDNIYILLAGGNVDTLKQQISELPSFQFKCIDFITDNRLLSLAYQAADIFVCPSVDDAGPMMVAESLSCGTPVVGFPVGLMFDQSCVINGKTGYVVEMKSATQLSKALKSILELDKKVLKEMSKKCREIALSELSQAKFVKNFNKLMECIGK